MGDGGKDGEERWMSEEWREGGGERQINGWEYERVNEGSPLSAGGSTVSAGFH